MTDLANENGNEEVFIWNDSCGGHHADGDELFNGGEEGK